MSSFNISGQFIDLFKRTIYPATISVKDGIIESVVPIESASGQYILPGFIDAHVHIESSMLPPTSFARMAVVHGTVATVSDPHEIANVCGIEGIDFMIENRKLTPLKIFFGAPSCVPATFFESSGATLDSKAVDKLLENPDIWYLSEIMNYPGLLNRDTEIMAKLAAAKRVGKPIDGHAPGLRGKLAMGYADAGITTDHESYSLEEALDKVKAGMSCLIREGSAAKNFDALIDIIRTHPYSVMFCTDDKHPDELLLHHINDHVKRAMKSEYDLFDILRAACVHPVVHYNLPVGLLRQNDPADFIVVNNLTDFEVLRTYIDGQLVAENGKSLLPHIDIKPINNFNASNTTPQDFSMRARAESTKIRVIEALEGQLITNCYEANGKIEDGFLVSDVPDDILKIAVINRYSPAIPPSIAFIKNFGLKRGAIASTIAHDSHNIIVVGVDDVSMSASVNSLIESKGRISVAEDYNTVECLPLSIAGLMSTEDAYKVAERYTDLDKKAKELGTSLKSPFMTLSFMALLVIPSLKLSDKGLFDGKEFRFTDVEI